MHEYRINEQIRAETVRLVDENGNQVGIVSISEALEKAKAVELDLVEVAPNLDPPVCKILDYGKFKYQQKKKQHHHHYRPHLKEIRIGLSTGEHDLEVKARRIREFLAKRDKVLVSMQLRGRERGHIDIGRQVLEQFAARFADISKIERPQGKQSGSKISILLAPK